MISRVVETSSGEGNVIVHGLWSCDVAVVDLHYGKVTDYVVMHIIAWHKYRYRMYNHTYIHR